MTVSVSAREKRYYAEAGLLKHCCKRFRSKSNTRKGLGYKIKSEPQSPESRPITIRQTKWHHFESTKTAMQTFHHLFQFNVTNTYFLILISSVYISVSHRRLCRRLFFLVFGASSTGSGIRIATPSLLMPDETNASRVAAFCRSIAWIVSQWATSNLAQSCP